MMLKEVIHTQCLIIGAGPYGIALANQLHEDGNSFVIVGDTFSLWYDHTHPDLPIRSDWQTSEIYSPSSRFCFKTYIRNCYPDNWQHILDHRIGGDVFRGYLEQVQDQLPFEVIETRVVGLNQIDNLKFGAELEDGRSIQADNVVLATGIEPHRYLPEEFSHLPEHLCKHSWHLSDFLDVTNKKILVLGRGQSAAEAVAHLSTNNQISWVCRQKPKFYNEPINLPAPIFKALRYLSRVYFYLPGLLHKKLAKTFTEVTVTPDMEPKINHVEQIRCDAEGLELTVQKDKLVSAKLSTEFDFIVAATGYRYRLSSFGFLSQELKDLLDTDESSCPRVNSRFKSNVKGFYMMGGITESSHGPAMRFMMGAPFAARTISKTIFKK